MPPTAQTNTVDRARVAAHPGRTAPQPPTYLKVLVKAPPARQNRQRGGLLVHLILIRRPAKPSYRKNAARMTQIAYLPRRQLNPRAPGDGCRSSVLRRMILWRLGCPVKGPRRPCHSGRTAAARWVSSLSTTSYDNGFARRSTRVGGKRRCLKEHHRSAEAVGPRRRVRRGRFYSKAGCA